MAGALPPEKLIENIKFINDILYAGKPLMIPFSYVIQRFIPSRVRIVREENFTAATDADNLYVNPEFWSKLGIEEKKFVLAHEASHVMTADTEFIKTVEYPDLFNIAADCVINRSLRKIYSVSQEFLKEIVTPESVHKMALQLAEIAGLPTEKVPPVSWFESATQWQIYSYLSSLYKKAKKRVRGPKKGGKGGTEGKKGRAGGKEGVERKEKEGGFGAGDPDEVVEKQTGKALSGDVKKSKHSVEEGKARREKYRQLNEEVKKVFRERGGAAGAEESSPVDRLLDATARGIDWRKYLDYVISSTARMYVTTWKRPSRRHRSYPGYQKFGFPSVVVLIDVSGSIPDDDLARFVDEVYSMSVKYGIREIRIIYWSDQVVRDVLVRSPADVEREKRIAGHLPSGGTVFRSALERAMKYAGPDKVVVTFSDGYIFDTGISGLAVSVGSRFRKAVFVTTAEKPTDEVPEPPWTYVEYIVGAE